MFGLPLIARARSAGRDDRMIAAVRSKMLNDFILFFLKLLKCTIMHTQMEHISLLSSGWSKCYFSFFFFTHHAAFLVCHKTNCEGRERPAFYLLSVRDSNILFYFKKGQRALGGGGSICELTLVVNESMHACLSP